MAHSYGTATALSGNANSAASGTYTSLGVISFGTAPPDECWVEVSLQASAAPSGNTQAVIYARDTLDGTNYSDAPISTTEINARQIGILKLPDTSAHRSLAFPLGPFFGNGLPPGVEIFVKNDCGVAFAATGQTGQYRTETL